AGEGAHAILRGIVDRSGEREELRLDLGGGGGRAGPQRQLHLVHAAAQLVAGAARGAHPPARSNRPAMPWPTPMHMVARPRRAPRRRSSWRRVATMRAPEQPSGWASAMAPPVTLTRSAGRAGAAS